ncbi:hypothetical protein Z042_22960 [Chania multitudinisentens RB-25]|uniref:Uncharacterized protein n=1 Tax=Chania multitudinisentens RB-25 TaxID=1441930 RepID=W0LE82_9GAMM|nr:hypothetical protein [Chania multitudinisentens]AHG22163.1 hypothetical protein Z042_22960 [Chania multitudinisentens RB-25]
MKIEHGRREVWQHAAEANMQDVIKKIAAIFDIDDIAIFTPGKLTYLKNKPVKYKRIRPFEADVYLDPATGELLAKKE